MTRSNLLNAALQEFWRTGFQAAGLEAILGRAGVTKGALYHHFSNKQELGYAVVDELIRDWIYQQWVRPLSGARNPLDALAGIIGKMDEYLTEEVLAHGCPCNNLIQEMAPIDEGFRTRLERVMRTWRDGFADALRRGQANGTVRPDLDADRSAIFLIAALEGTWALVKATRNESMVEDCRDGLLAYLESLRPHEPAVVTEPVGRA